MTDPLPPLSDEDLSAALDGQAAPDVVARIAADPAARARSEWLARAAASVQAPVTPLAASVVDDLVSRALAAASVEQAPDVPAGPKGSVSIFAPPPPARRRGPTAWLVAAAVVALVAIGLGLVWSGTRDGSTTTDTAIADTAADQAADSSTEGHGGSSGEFGEPPPPSSDSNSAVPTTNASGEEQPDAPDGAVPADPVDLGSFDSGDDLREALATSFPESDSGEGLPVPTSANVDRCAENLSITLDLGRDPVSQGYATVAGQAALVYEFAITSFDDGTSDTTLVAAVGQDACDQIVLFER